MSTTSRVRSSTSSVNEVEDYSIASAILEALEVEGGDPLGIFRKAAEHMQPSERSKTEHYIAAIYSLIMKRTSELAVNGSGPPLAILKLQLYAIECLLENSSYFATPASTAGSVTTDDKSVTSLAGNLNRALISFGKMSTANGIPEAELASQISQKVLPLIRRIREVIRPEERLLVSKAYLELTNLLVQLFDKGSIDATTLLQHCQPSSLKSSDPSMALETSSPSETVAEVDMEREALHLNSILTTQVTCLEQWISSGCSSLRIDGDAMQDALKSAAKFLRLDVQSTTDTKIRKSITRNLERMHHFAYRAYKDWHKESEGGLHAKADIIETNPTLRELLSSFCVTVEVARGPPELLARAVDTLLLFARLDFRLHEPVTYKQVHQNIERCIALLDSADPPSLQDSRLFGTLASSAYSIGRALYNAEKHANAVPFLRNSCTSTDRMIDMSKNANSSISLADLLDKSASRWELLGSAYTHCQEKEDALKSYSACLHMLHQQRQEGSATELLLDSTFMRVLAKYTKLSILDLLMDPETACIAERLSSMSTSQAGNLIKAQILDAHSLCLQEYLHKPEAVLASTYWLDAAIVAYDTCARNSDLARYVPDDLSMLEFSGFSGLILPSDFFSGECFLRLGMVKKGGSIMFKH